MPLVIVRPNLEADFEAKRAGKPDLLVWHEDGYAPVDIKYHLTLDALARRCRRSRPAPPAAPRQGRRLQLAHCRRMLEALAVAATEPWGGIIGKEARIVWYPLAEPMWRTPAKSDGKKVKHRTTLEAYDFEFEFGCGSVRGSRAGRSSTNLGCASTSVQRPATWRRRPRS